MILCIKLNLKIAHISCDSAVFFTALALTLCRRMAFFSSCFATLKVIDDITFSQNTYHMLYGL